MGSLYQRATALRKRIDRDIQSLETSLGGEMAQWTTPEERRQILIDLDGITARAAVQATPDRLSFTPERSDRLLPLLFNIAAVVLTVGAILAVTYFFAGDQRSLSAANENLLTAETRLFAAFREQTEEELSLKDSQIVEAQRRIEEIRQERDRLRQEGESMIAERTRQLQVEMEGRLNQERQRLAGQGLSTTAIDSRVRDLEQELARAREQELDRYRRQVDEELASRQASLDALRSEYSQNLEQLETEKTRLETSLREAETDYRVRLARDREALERERTAAAAELESIRAQSEKERLALDQILSGYAGVIAALREGDYARALERLDAIESFLSQEAIAALPAVQRRRSVEGFIIQSLRELIEDQRTAATRPTTDLVAAAELLTSVARIVEQADTAFGRGNADRARELYVSAIQMIPRFSQSYPILRSLERSGLEEEVRSLQANVDELQGVVARLRSELEALSREPPAGAAGQENAARIAALEARIVELEARLAQANRELDSRRSELGELRALLGSRQALLSEIDAVRRRLTSPGSPETTEVGKQQQLLELLETRLLLKKVLASNVVRQTYPSLYEDVEQYLLAYSQIFQQEGQAETMRDTIRLLQALERGETTEAVVPILESYDSVELRELVERFFTVLHALVE